jgi:hypothetical protein
VTMAKSAATAAALKDRRETTRRKAVRLDRRFVIIG